MHYEILLKCQECFLPANEASMKLSPKVGSVYEELYIFSLSCVTSSLAVMINKEVVGWIPDTCHTYSHMKLT